MNKRPEWCPLKEAKELIKIWHNMGANGKVMWDIYDKQSPEMQRINKTIDKATSLTK